MAGAGAVAAVAAAVGGAGATAVTDGFIINTNLHEAGPWALLVGVVAFMVFGLFKGWVVVKLHYDTLLQRAIAAEQANEKLSERAAKLTETNAVLAGTIEKQSAASDTVTRVMHAIQEARLVSGDPS